MSLEKGALVTATDYNAIRDRVKKEIARRTKYYNLNNIKDITDLDPTIAVVGDLLGPENQETLSDKVIQLADVEN